MGLEAVRVNRLRRQASSTGTAPATTGTSPTTLATSQPSSGANQSSGGNQSSGANQATGSNSGSNSGSTNTGSPAAAAGSSVSQNAQSSGPTTTPGSSASVVVSSSSGSSQDVSSVPSSSASRSSSSASSASGSSSTSSSQSASSPGSNLPSSSTTSSTTSDTPTSSTISTTDSSTPSSSTDTTAISSDPSSSSDSSTTTPPTSTTSTDPKSGTSLTTITSAIVTTINGQVTTITTTIPTTLNSAPTTTPGQRSGIIAGSAIGATLLVLLVLSGLFVYHRRQARRKIAFAHRALPAPRSALLAGEDGFDLTGPHPPMGEGVPPLLRPRGMETGSIFHEGVWPPPGERSRLEDPLLAGSNVDLTSIVDSVMGGEANQHDRSSSGGTAMSTSPLLADFSPVRGGKGYPPSAFASMASQPGARERSRLGLSSDPTETTPFNPSGHEHQLSIDTSPGSPRPDSSVLPPGAAPPYARGKVGPSNQSISTTGSPPSDVPHLRGGAPSGFGSLMVVNSTPEVEQDNPLVDLTPNHEEPPKEIPPLYHMIRRDTADTWKSSAPSAYSQTSNAEAQRSPPLPATSGSGSGAAQARAPSPGNVGQAL